MKVLIVGGGGREHALAWAAAQSPKKPIVYAAPGNAGIAEFAKTVPIQDSDVEALARFAEQERCDLTIVGPEAPLVAGIVDLFRSRRLRIFGPEKRAAVLEGSKVFAKDLMQRHGIPTAPYETFNSPEYAEAAIRSMTYPKVIKADGLAAGKGVSIVRNRDEALAAMRRIMVERRFGPAGERIVIEEFLEGEEVSVFALCRSTNYFLLPTSQDHKRLLEGDRGPNTGGMGAYAPYPRWDDRLEAKVRSEIIEPTLHALAREERSYHGLLYFGLILCGGRPYVLEFNCRFGDPETQVVLPLVEGDLLEALDCASAGEPGELPQLSVRNASAGVVVLASGGYPEKYEKGFPIRGIERARELPGVLVFHAGTRRGESGPLTNGGRVLGVVGVANDLKAALRTAYEGASMIEFEGMILRKDIGRRGIAS